MPIFEKIDTKWITKHKNSQKKVTFINLIFKIQKLKTQMIIKPNFFFFFLKKNTLTYSLTFLQLQSK